MGAVMKDHQASLRGTRGTREHRQDTVTDRLDLRPAEAFEPSKRTPSS
jgi:hypothetical protein